MTRKVGLGQTIVNLLDGCDVRNVIVAGHGPPDAPEPMRFHRRYPDAKIYSFEPQRDFYEECVQQYQDIPEIAMLPQALGDCERTVVLQVSDKHGWSSIHEFNPDWEYGTRPINCTYEVPMTTVDVFCSEHGIGELDLLFLDVQNSEHLVFEGACRMLATGSIKVVVGESIFTNLHGDIHSFWKSYATLSMAHGYRFIGWYRPSQRPWGQIMFCDYIFARPDVLSATIRSFDGKS